MRSRTVNLSLRATLLLQLVYSAASPASENGQVHYPVGVNSIMNAVLPAPGETEAYHYVMHYHSTRLNDARGHSLDDNFEADVVSWAPRVVHTWKTMLGPFFLSSGIITPINRVEVHAFGRKDVSTGFSDPVLQPLYLYYVNKDGTFFAHAGPDIYVPIGRYDKDSVANNGLNHWTIAPSFNATWMPTPRWELSSTLYTEFHARNPDTDYKSGNNVTLDFNVAYRPMLTAPKLKVALQGYVLKQFTDDQKSGVDFENGNRGQAFALGPQLSYDIADGKGAVLLKYQREFAVENRTQGQRLWFEVAIPF